jgi:type III secretory pathway component EscS
MNVYGVFNLPAYIIALITIFAVVMIVVTGWLEKISFKPAPPAEFGVNTHMRDEIVPMIINLLGIIATLVILIAW